MERSKGFDGGNVRADGWLSLVSIYRLDNHSQIYSACFRYKPAFLATVLHTHPLFPFTYALVLYMFTLKTMYAKYPRFRKKYHPSIVLPIIKELLKELLKKMTFFLRKRRALGLFGFNQAVCCHLVV